MSGLEPAVDLVERAKSDLVAAIPSPRGVQAVPLAEALMRFEQSLRGAGEVLAVRPDAARFAEAVAESLGRAERLRLDAPELDYEGLVAALGDLIDPLEIFAEAG